MKKKIKLKPTRRVYSEILGVERVEFDDCKNPNARRSAEIEAMRDLLKPEEQLLADVHEEAENNRGVGRIAGAIKRMVSLQVRVVQSNDRLNRRMLSLTRYMTLMTGVILVLTYLMFEQQRQSSTQQQSTAVTQPKSP